MEMVLSDDNAEELTVVDASRQRPFALEGGGSFIVSKPSPRRSLGLNAKFVEKGAKNRARVHGSGFGARGSSCC